MGTVVGLSGDGELVETRVIVNRMDSWTWDELWAPEISRGEPTVYCADADDMTSSMARELAVVLIEAAELVEQDAASG